jgi:hypothetical protein
MGEFAAPETGWIDEMRQHIGTGGSGIPQEYWNHTIDQGLCIIAILAAWRFVVGFHCMQHS